MPLLAFGAVAATPVASRLGQETNETGTAVLAALICLLCMEDYSGRWAAAEMDVTALGTVHQWSDSQSPSWMVVWSRRDMDPYVFRSLDDFRRTVHQEGESAEFTSMTVLSEELRSLSGLERLHGTVAQR